MKLPESPHDRRARDEALMHLAKRAAIAIAPTLLVGALAHALGVPWLLVLLAIIIVIYLAIFHS